MGSHLCRVSVAGPQGPRAPALPNPQVLLLTDDRACQQKARQDGLAALRAAEFVERMRPKRLREMGLGLILLKGICSLCS